MDELNAQIDLDRTVLSKKPFDRDDDQPTDGGTVTKVVSTTDPDSGQQTREGKPDGFHYSKHRTVDSKNNVIMNVHVEPANINDIMPLPKILDEINSGLAHCQSKWDWTRTKAFSFLLFHSFILQRPCFLARKHGLC